MEAAGIPRWPRIPAQRGVALPVALVVLVGVTVISLASLRTGLLEMVMAGNEEARINAFQQALNGLDAVSSVNDNFSVTGGVGYTNCTPGHSGADTVCDAVTLALPDGYDATHNEIYVERVGPLKTCPPRVMNTSCESFNVASFAAHSAYDDLAARGGRSVQKQGYMVLVPNIDPGRQ